MAKPPTIRSIAHQLGLSVATVSEALRDSAQVKPSTKARIVKAAAAVGYERNPLLGATFSALRQGRHQGFSGTLALVDEAQDGRTELMLFHREVARGAEARAKQLGFKTDVFWIGRSPPALSITRLNYVLRARGISGVILLPFDQRQDFRAFDFTHLSAVSMDHRLINPQLHTVQPDHYLSMRRCLETLTERGYSRIGLCLEARKDARVDHKWSSGFLSFFRLNDQRLAVPPLIESTLDKKTFNAWYRRHKPDVIISHAQSITSWLEEQSVRIPDDVGFFRINVTERSTPCAGLNLQPDQLGATAVEAVVGMLHRREHGVPVCPNSISIDAVFMDGPTLRPSSPAR